jgi:hypothetical protein
MDYPLQFKSKHPSVFREFAIAICELLLEHEWPAETSQLITNVLTAVRADPNVAGADMEAACFAASSAALAPVPQRRVRAHAANRAVDAAGLAGDAARSAHSALAAYDANAHVQPPYVRYACFAADNAAHFAAVAAAAALPEQRDRVQAIVSMLT